MLIQFLFYVVIYIFTAIDYLLSIIPYMSTVSGYATMVPDMMNSFLGTLHGVFPETLATFCILMSVYVGVYYTFLILRIVKKIIPFIGH